MVGGGGGGGRNLSQLNLGWDNRWWGANTGIQNVIEGLGRNNKPTWEASATTTSYNSPRTQDERSGNNFNNEHHN